MTIKKAIEKAIKGGYRGKILDYFLKHNNEVIDTTNCDVLGTLLIDPLFWQSLGKATKKYHWKKNTCGDYGCMPVWEYTWHEFIGHLAEGKDIESFSIN